MAAANVKPQPNLVIQDSFTPTTEPRALGTYNEHVWCISGTGKYPGVQIDSLTYNRFHQFLPTTSQVVAVTWVPYHHFSTAKEWRFVHARNFTQTSGVFVAATPFSLEAFAPDPVTQKWRPLWSISPPTFGTTPSFEIASLAVSPGATHVLCGSPSGLKMWNVEEKIAVWSLQDADTRRPPGAFTDSRLLSFSSDGRLLVTCPVNSQMVRIWWHAESGETGLMAFRLLAHPHVVTCLEFNSRMGNFQQSLLTVTVDGVIRIWQETSREDDFDFYLIMKLDAGMSGVGCWMRYGIEYEGLLWSPHQTFSRPASSPLAGTSAPMVGGGGNTPSSGGGGSHRVNRNKRRWGAMMNGHGHVMMEDEVLDGIEFRIGSYPQQDTIRDWLMVISPTNMKYQIWMIESLGKRREKRCQMYGEWTLEASRILSTTAPPSCVLAFTRIILPPAIDFTSMFQHPNSLWADNPPDPMFSQVYICVKGAIVSLLFDRGAIVRTAPLHPLQNLWTSSDGKTLMTRDGDGNLMVYNDDETLHADCFTCTPIGLNVSLNFTPSSSPSMMRDCILINRDLVCFLMVGKEGQENDHETTHLVYYKRLPSTHELVFEVSMDVHCEDLGTPLSLVLFLGRMVVLCEKGLALCELPTERQSVGVSDGVGDLRVEMIWVGSPSPPSTSPPTGTQQEQPQQPNLIISCATTRLHDGSLLIATRTGALLTFSSSNLSNNIDSAIVRNAFTNHRPTKLISASTLPSLVIAVCDTNRLVTYVSGGTTLQGKNTLEGLHNVSDAAFYEFGHSGFELLGVAFSSATASTSNAFTGIRVYMFHAQTGNITPMAESPCEPCTHLTWMSNGRIAAITQHSGRLILFADDITSSTKPLTTNTEQFTFLNHDDATTSPHANVNNNAVIVQLEALGRMTWTGEDLQSPLSLPEHHPICILENLRLGNVTEAGFALHHIVANIIHQTSGNEDNDDNTGKTIYIPLMVPGEEQSSFRAQLNKQKSSSVMLDGDDDLDDGNNNTLDSPAAAEGSFRHSPRTSMTTSTKNVLLLTPATLKEAEEKLVNVTIAGLNSVERLKLLVALDSFRTVSSSAATMTVSSLDNGASRFLLSIRLFRVAQKTLPPKDRPTCLRTCDVAWAVHSDADLSKLAFAETGGVTWPDARVLGMGLWFCKASKETCVAMAEMMARTQYLKNKDPVRCLLFYVAVGKVKVAGKFFQAAQQNKIADLLANDFTTEKYQTVAVKNAYAALSKQKFEEAAAFFLLGNKISDAIRICVRNLEDFQLGLFLCRVVDSNEAKECMKDILQNTVLPLAVTCHDPWLASTAWTLLQKPEEAIACFFAPDITEEDAAPTLLSHTPSSSGGGGITLVANTNSPSRVNTPASVSMMQQQAIQTPEHQIEWFMQLGSRIQPRLTQGFDPTETSFLKFLAALPRFSWGEGKHFVSNFDLSMSDERAAQHFLRASLPLLCLQFATDDQTRREAVIRAGIPYALTSSSATWLEKCFRGLSARSKVEYDALLDGVSRACRELNYARGELACAELRGEVDGVLAHYVDCIVSFFATSTHDEWSRSSQRFVTWALFLSDCLERYANHINITTQTNVSLTAHVMLCVGAMLANEYGVVDGILGHGISKGQPLPVSVGEEAERLAQWLCQSSSSHEGDVLLMGNVALPHTSTARDGFSRISSAGSEDTSTTTTEFPLPSSTPPPPPENTRRVPNKSPSHPSLITTSWSTQDKDLAEKWADVFALFVLRYLSCEVLLYEVVTRTGGVTGKVLDALRDVAKRRFLHALHVSAPRPASHLSLPLLTEVLRRFMTSKRAFSDMHKQVLWIKCNGPERIQQFALELAFAFRGLHDGSGSGGGGEGEIPSSLGSGGSVGGETPSPVLGMSSSATTPDQKKALPVTLYQRTGHPIHSVCICNAIPDYMIIASDTGIRDVNVDSALRHRERTPDGRGLTDNEAGDWAGAFSRFKNFEFAKTNNDGATTIPPPSWGISHWETLISGPAAFGGGTAPPFMMPSSPLPSPTKTHFFDLGQERLRHHMTNGVKLADKITHDNVNALRLCAHPFLPHYVSGGMDGTVLLWAVGEPTAIARFARPVRESWKERSPVLRLRISPDGTRLITTDKTGSVVLWHFGVAPEPISPYSGFSGHKDAVTDTVFMNSGSFLATASLDSHVMFWDTLLPPRSNKVATTRVPSSDSSGTSVGIHSMVYVPNENVVIIGCGTSLFSYDVRKNRFLGEVREAHGRIINNIEMNPTRQSQIATSSQDGSVKTWSVVSGQLVQVATYPSLHKNISTMHVGGSSGGNSNGITGLAFSRHSAIVTSGWDGTVKAVMPRE